MTPASVARVLLDIGCDQGCLGYDALGDVTALTDPNGNLTQSAWDADRRLTQVTAPPAPQALVTAYSYDPDGRLVGTKQSASGTVLAATSAAYTPSGQLETAIDARGNITRYAYDAADRLARVTDPVGRVTTYSYDAMSRRTGVFNPAIQGGVLWWPSATPRTACWAASPTPPATQPPTVMDGVDRLSATTFPDNSSEALTYDANGNVLTRKTRKGDTIVFAYDNLNRVATKTAPGEAPVTYGYDLAGRLIRVGDTSAAVKTPAAPASYSASTTYDAMNRPLAVTWTPAAAQTAPTASGTSFGYGYDATNRRITETASDKSWWSYPTAAGATAYTANNLNQYTAVGAASPTYDQNGNLGYDGTFTYGYDAESRLVSVKQGSTAVASYAWDAQGRRKSKTVGAATTMFVTDADNHEVLEYDGTSGAIERCIYSVPRKWRSWRIHLIVHDANRCDLSVKVGKSGVMANCSLKYDLISTGFNDWWFPGIGLAAAALAAVIYGILSAVPAKYTHAYTKKSVVAALLISLAWSLVTGALTYRGYHTLRQTYKRGSYQQIYGVINNFVNSGREIQPGTVRFNVGGIAFSYSKYIISPGYRGEPSGLYDGLSVRIRYIGRSIVRLEVCDA